MDANGIHDEQVRELRIELGGEKSLEPIFAELQRNLDENFTKPIHGLNEETIAAWKDSIAKANFWFLDKNRNEYNRFCDWDWACALGRLRLFLWPSGRR